MQCLLFTLKLYKVESTNIGRGVCRVYSGYFISQVNLVSFIVYSLSGGLIFKFKVEFGCGTCRRKTETFEFRKYNKKTQSILRITSFMSINVKVVPIS